MSSPLHGHMSSATPRRKKFQPGEYVITDTGSGPRLALVVEDWHTTLPHEVRLDFPGGGSRLDRWQDSCCLASERQIKAGHA